VISKLRGTTLHVWESARSMQQAYVQRGVDAHGRPQFNSQSSRHYLRNRDIFGDQGDLRAVFVGLPSDHHLLRTPYTALPVPESCQCLLFTGGSRTKRNNSIVIPVCTWIQQLQMCSPQEQVL